MSLRALLVVAGLGLSGIGCGGSRHLLRPALTLSPTAEGGALLRRQMEGWAERLSGIKRILDFEAEAQGTRSRARGVFLWQRIPPRARLDLFGPFSETLVTAISQEESLAIWMPQRDLLLHSVEELPEVPGLEWTVGLGGEEIWGLLRGLYRFPALVSGGDGTLGWREGDRAILQVETTDRVHRFWLDGEASRLLRYEQVKGGEPYYQATFRRFRAVAGVALPQEVLVRGLRPAFTLRLEVRAERVNPRFEDPALFQHP